MPTGYPCTVLTAAHHIHPHSSSRSCMPRVSGVSGEHLLFACSAQHGRQQQRTRHPRPAVDHPEDGLDRLGDNTVDEDDARVSDDCACDTSISSARGGSGGFASARGGFGGFGGGRHRDSRPSSPSPAAHGASGKNSDFFHTPKGMKQTHKGMKTHCFSRKRVFHTLKKHFIPVCVCFIP